jgi:hypothetical protein
MPLVPRRSRPAWLLVFALTVAGWLSAHEVAYRLVISHPHDRSSALAETGHAYFAYSSLAVVLCVLFALLGTAGLVVRPLGRPPPSRRLLMLFALAPPLGFALQEHLERLLATGDLPSHAALETTFLVGLLLQVPFALAALIVARALFAFARGLARALGSFRRPILASIEIQSAPIAEAHRPRLSALAWGDGERGPPLPAAS